MLQFLIIIKLKFEMLLKVINDTFFSGVLVRGIQDPDADAVATAVGGIVGVILVRMI